MTASGGIREQVVVELEVRGRLDSQDAAVMAVVEAGGSALWCGHVPVLLAFRLDPVLAEGLKER